MSLTGTKPPDSPKALTRGIARKDEEHDLAVHIGRVIRERRNQLGLSQTDLGDAVGITFQQIQKYEKGVNRVSGPTLMRMATVLQVPMDYFFPKPGEALPAVPNVRPSTLTRIDMLAEQVRRLADELEKMRAVLKKAESS